MMPLTFATAGEENIIKKVGGKTDVRSHLENLGFVPGEYREYILSRIEAHRMTHTTVEAVEMAAGNQTVSIKIIC